MLQFTERALAHELLTPTGGPTSNYHICYARLKLQKKEFTDAEESLTEALQFDHQVRGGVQGIFVNLYVHCLNLHEVQA